MLLIQMPKLCENLRQLEAEMCETQGKALAQEGEQLRKTLPRTSASHSEGSILSTEFPERSGLTQVLTHFQKWFTKRDKT